jgi:hypothetical protein
VQTQATPSEGNLPVGSSHSKSLMLIVPLDGADHHVSSLPGSCGLTPVSKGLRADNRLLGRAAR